MRTTTALLAANALLLLLLQAHALPAPPMPGIGGVRGGAKAGVVPGKKFAHPELKKSPSPFTALKIEMSVDEALDRAATFRQYFLVGFKWTVETLAIMGGVFATQKKFTSKHESILGSFNIQGTGIVGICNSCFFAGQAAGVLAAGRVGDLFGRRAAVLASSATISMFSFLTAFVGSPGLFALMRLFTGFGVGLGGSNAYVLATEFTGSKHNGIAGIGMAAFGSLGMLLIAPLAYQLKNWRVLFLVVALANLYPVLLRALIFESPRWFLAHGREDEARATILKAIESVRHLSPEDEALHLTMPAPAGGSSATHREGIKEGLQHAQFRSRLLVMAGCWFVVGLVFYGLACNVGKVPGGAYTNQALFAVADLAAIPLQLLLVSRLGRRASMGLVSGIAALGLVSSASVDAVPALALVPAKAKLLVAKAAVTAYFAIVYIYAAELFPTSIRSTGMAACSLAARIATILAPLLLSVLDFAAPSSSSSSSLPPLVSSSAPHGQLASLTSPSALSRWLLATGTRMGVLNMSGELLLHSLFAAAMLASGAAAVLFLPETKGLGLPQTLSDLVAPK